jgi:hypothetical protein
MTVSGGSRLARTRADPLGGASRGHSRERPGSARAGRRRTARRRPRGRSASLSHVCGARSGPARRSSRSSRLMGSVRRWPRIVADRQYAGSLRVLRRQPAGVDVAPKNVALAPGPCLVTFRINKGFVAVQSVQASCAFTPLGRSVGAEANRTNPSGDGAHVTHTFAVAVRPPTARRLER